MGAHYMFCFPRKRWTRFYFDRVLDLCNQQGIPYDVVETTLGHRSEQEYLIALFGSDFSAAYRFVKVVLLDVLGVDPNRRYLTYVEGTERIARKLSI